MRTIRGATVEGSVSGPHDLDIVPQAVHVFSYRLSRQTPGNALLNATPARSEWRAATVG